MIEPYLGDFAEPHVGITAGVDDNALEILEILETTDGAQQVASLARFEFAP